MKPLIILSIQAISIHTVTAFIYAGLPGRGFWLTAIMAPRFLASAFASGPALLILLCLVLKRFARFDAGQKAIQALARIVAYALARSIFFVLVEIFTSTTARTRSHAPHDLSLRRPRGADPGGPRMTIPRPCFALCSSDPARHEDAGGWLALACVGPSWPSGLKKGLGS